jgi:predicted amidophosphoribosyltransferase
MTTSSVAGHGAALRRLISRYKYGGAMQLAVTLAGVLVDFLDQHQLWFEEFDLLVGVPSYVGPGARRDWDPVGGILAQLAEQAGSSWPVVPGAVMKTAETPQMTGLGAEARRVLARTALRRALSVPSPALVAGARILVVDDVFTEGSTLTEVARALSNAGATEVAGLTLARQPWWDARPERLAMVTM